MALDDIARGALHLIRWGKDIVPATAEEIEKFGKNAPRVKALADMVYGLSDNAVRVAGNASAKTRPLLDTAFTNLVKKIDDEEAVLARNAWEKSVGGIEDRLLFGNNTDAIAAWNASGYGGAAESAADILTPQDYRTLVNPIIAARSYDLSAPRTPEGFSNIVYGLGERGLITAPKDIRIARRIAQLPPDIQKVYLNLLQEDTDPMELLAAMKVLGE